MNEDASAKGHSKWRSFGPFGQACDLCGVCNQTWVQRSSWSGSWQW